MMIQSAIEEVVERVNKLGKNYTCSQYTIAEEIGEDFGFLIGRDFTNADIEAEMLKYIWK